MENIGHSPDESAELFVTGKLVIRREQRLEDESKLLLT
jgi:hypothetical protein